MAAAHAASMSGTASAAGTLGQTEISGMATTGYLEAAPMTGHPFVQVSVRHPLWVPHDAPLGMVAVPVGVALLGAAVFMAARMKLHQLALLRQFDRPAVFRPGFSWPEPGPTVGERLQSWWRSGKALASAGQARFGSLQSLWGHSQSDAAPQNLRLNPPTTLDPAEIAGTPAGRTFYAGGVKVRPMTPGPEGPMVDYRSPRLGDVRQGWLTFPPDSELPVMMPFAIVRKAVQDRRALFFSAPGEGQWWVEPVPLRYASDASWPAPHNLVVGLRMGRLSLEDNPNDEASVSLPWSEAWATENPMSYHPMMGAHRDFVPPGWSGYAPLTLTMRHHVADVLWSRLTAQWSTWSVAEKDAVNVLALAMTDGRWLSGVALQVLKVMLEGEGAAQLLVRQVADAVHRQRRAGVIALTPLVPVPPDPNGTRAIEQGIIHLIVPEYTTPLSPFGTDIDPELQPDVAVQLSPWTLRSLAHVVEELYQQLPGAHGWNAMYPPAVHPDLATPAYVRYPDHVRRVIK